MTSLLDEPGTDHSDSPSQRLQQTMAAARLSFTWLGVRKTLTAAQKDRAANSFGAETLPHDPVRPVRGAGRPLYGPQHDLCRFHHGRADAAPVHTLAAGPARRRRPAAEPAGRRVDCAAGDCRCAGLMPPAGRCIETEGRVVRDDHQAAGRGPPPTFPVRQPCHEFRIRRQNDPHFA